MKDLFLSIPRMHDIFNLFIWVKQSFQEGKPMRHDKAELGLVPPSNACLQRDLYALTQIYLVVIVCVCGVSVLKWCISFWLLFVFFLYIDWLLPWMWALWWDLGTKSTSGSSLLSPHQSNWWAHKTINISPPHLFIHPFISFIWSCLIKFCSKWKLFVYFSSFV